MISGWAHGAEAMAPLGRLMAGIAEVTIITTGDLWPGPRSPGTPSPWAQCLAEKAARIGGEIFVAGWSMGGMIALEAAGLRPGLFKGLVLIAATPKFCSGPDWKPGVPPAALRAMCAGLRRAGSAVLAEFFRQAALPAVETKDRLQGKTEAAQAMNPLELSAGLQYLSAADLRNGARGVAAPALVLHGRGDTIIPAEAGRALKELLPASKVKIIGGGHALPWQAPGAVAANMRGFLQACLSQHNFTAAP